MNHTCRDPVTNIMRFQMVVGAGLLDPVPIPFLPGATAHLFHSTDTSFRSVNSLLTNVDL